MKILKFSILFSVIFVFGSVDVFACTCSSPPPIYQKFDEAEAVFSGKVISKNMLENVSKETDNDEQVSNGTRKERVFRFQIFDSFKGKKGKFIDINLGVFNPACESNFTVGESYLIYAYGDDEEDVLRDGACSRSRYLEQADVEIQIIREKIAGKPEAKIYGSVSRSDTFPDSLKLRYTPIQKTIVILENEQKRFETITDKRGIFKFTEHIPDGNYYLFPRIESKDYISPEKKEIKIENGKTSIDYNGFGFVDFYSSFFTGFSLNWDNEIQGKIYDGEGKPVKLAAVRLLPFDAPFEKIESDDNLDEDDEGKFSDYFITPGKYYLVAEIYAPFGGKDKVRIFYPQAETPEKATPIEIKATSKLSFDIILPQKYVLREIKGNISWSDGQPADNSDIRLFKTENHQIIEQNDEISNTGYDKTDTDELGNFVLWGFENQEYWIHFENETEVMVDGEEEYITVKSKPIKIIAKKDIQPLKLTLTKP